MANASIDLAAAAHQGVTVCGTGGSGNAVPELTIGMMVALTRNFAPQDATVRAGGWQHTVGPGLSGSTLGIVGLGRLGAPAANPAQAFGMTVVASSPHLPQARGDRHGVRAVTKHELFETADVISIHVPLFDTSRDLCVLRRSPLALLSPLRRGGPMLRPAEVAMADRRSLQHGGLSADCAPASAVPLGPTAVPVLPKGGGAIRGIGETFTTNPVTAPR
jgi:hypothetical protein